MEELRKAENHSITKSAFRVMAGGVLSLAAGLVNQVLIADIYGAGSGMDAYLTALIIPYYFDLVLLGGLSFVFIPAFVREESSGKEEDAWALVGTFIWITLVVTFAIAIVGMLLSGNIISLAAPGFVPQKSALAVNMLSVLMFSVPFSGISSFTVSVQNARNRFFWPSFGGAANSLGNIAVLLILHNTLGPMALAWAYLASTIVQAGVTVIPVIGHGWKKLLPLSDPRVREMGRLIVPLILSGLLISFSPIAERYFASGLPDGQISYIGYAYKISGIFVALLATGVASAIFPSMTRSFIQNGTHGLAEKNNYGLKLSFAVALPAIMITSAAAIPVVTILFQRGAFQPIDTIGVNRILFAVLLSDVLFRMVGNIFIRSSYVLKDTLTPPIVGSITAVIYLATGRFFVNNWGYTGLVWARVLQNGFYVGFLWLLLTRKLNYFHNLKTLARIFEYLLVASAAYVCSRFTLSKLVFAPVVLQLVIGCLIGITFYLLVLYLRDRDILKAIMEMTGVHNIFVKIQNSRSRSQQKLFIDKE